MTLIIKNVKEEYLSAFKGLAEGANATLTAESGNESSDETNECPICKSYNYEPSDELLEAIAEIERGEVTTYNSFEEYKANIDNE